MSVAICWFGAIFVGHDGCAWWLTVVAGSGANSVEG